MNGPRRKNRPYQQRHGRCPDCGRVILWVRAGVDEVIRCEPEPIKGVAAGPRVAGYFFVAHSRVCGGKTALDLSAEAEDAALDALIGPDLLEEANAEIAHPPRTTTTRPDYKRAAAGERD